MQIQPADSIYQQDEALDDTVVFAASDVMASKGIFKPVPLLVRPLHSTVTKLHLPSMSSRFCRMLLEAFCEWILQYRETIGLQKQQRQARTFYRRQLRYFSISYSKTQVAGVYI